MVEINSLAGHDNIFSQCGEKLDMTKLSYSIQGSEQENDTGKICIRAKSSCDQKLVGRVNSPGETKHLTEAHRMGLSPGI